MARSAAQDLANDVAASGVAQGHAVGHRHAHGADVLGHHPVRHALLALVGLARQLGNLLDQRQKHVVAVKVRHILHHAGDALQSHAGVDVLERQVIERRRAVRLRFLAVVLRKHQIPDFQKPRTLAGREVVGPGVVAVVRSPVVVDLAARSARPVGSLHGRVGGPEVLVCAEAVNVRRVQTDVLGPVAERLVIVLVNGHVHLRGVHVHPLRPRQKFPGPGNRLALEIIAETEVAHHLEEAQVAAGAAHVLDVAHPDALLGGGHAPALALLEAGGCAHELRLERLHPRHREERGRIGGDGGVRGQAQMLFGLEKVQELLADLARRERRASGLAGGLGSHKFQYSGGPQSRQAQFTSDPVRIRPSRAAQQVA